MPDVAATIDDVTTAKVLAVVFGKIELRLKKGARWADPGQMTLVCSKVSDLDP